MANDKVRHFREELQLLLDDRLSPADRSEVEQHLEVCPSCQREFEALRWSKQFAASQLSPAEAPSQLERDIVAALDEEDRGSTPRGFFGSLLRRPVLAYGLALSMVGMVLAVWLLQPPTMEIPCQIAHAFIDYRESRLPLEIVATDVSEIELGFEAAGVSFQTRVFDLGMMGYQAVGGRVHQLADRSSAFFVYRSSSGQILVCQMYLGHVSELPAELRSSMRENNNIEFHVYSEQGLTMVFWQEGEVTCVLTSDIDPEEVVQLAFAKAVEIN